MDRPRRHTLPLLQLAELADETSIDAFFVDGEDRHDGYFLSPKKFVFPTSSDAPPAEDHLLPLFPLVLNADGSPWPEATLYLLDLATEADQYEPQTLGYKADDLSNYRQFLDDSEVDWLDFPKLKNKRPTYRYKAYLKRLVDLERLPRSIANRRLGSVVGLYSRLIQDGHVQLAHEPWKMRPGVRVFFASSSGPLQKQVMATDLMIATTERSNPFDDCIQDEGKLRPLPRSEQDVLRETLKKIGNTEMTLVHLLSLVSSARIQTALTLRKKNFIAPPESVKGQEVRLLCKASLGIDTKKGKVGVLHVPIQLYRIVHTYIHSERYRSRANKADGGDQAEQYVFLSHNGSPFYDAKRDLIKSLQTKQRRYKRTGQAVRQFIKEKVLPLMQKTLCNPDYHFQFHDLRATFGLRWVEAMEPLIQSGAITYSKALDDLSTLMWHSSTEVTEQYLRYKSRSNEVRKMNEAYQADLDDLSLFFDP